MKILCQFNTFEHCARMFIFTAFAHSPARDITKRWTAVILNQAFMVEEWMREHYLEKQSNSAQLNKTALPRVLKVRNFFALLCGHLHEWCNQIWKSTFQEFSFCSKRALQIRKYGELAVWLRLPATIKIFWATTMKFFMNWNGHTESLKSIPLKPWKNLWTSNLHKIKFR